MKVTKAAARYTPQGTEREHCGVCRHFERPNACEKVEGLVTSGGWCRFFAKRGSVKADVEAAADA